MRFTRPLLLTAALLAFGALPAVGAHAQDGTVRNSETVSAEQNAQVEAWVTRQMNQIRSGLPEDVSAARDTLVKELRMPGTSAAYKTALGKAVLASGGELLKSKKLLIQANVVIVLAQVNTLDALQVLAPLVSDSSAGLRYKACQSMRLLIEPTPSERRSIGADREQILVKALAGQIVKEPDRDAYREMVELLNTIATPASQEALTNALNVRLMQHAENTDLSYDIELRAINALYQKFIQSDEKGKPLSNLLAVAYRHESLAIAQITGNPKDKGLQSADRKALLIACDKMIRAQYFRLGGSGQMPPEVSPMITFNKWKEAQDAVVKWKDLLKAAPLSIPEAKLK